MNVLSLFDGISCGMLALERAGINVDRYIAYEIEDNVINISKKHYPQIEHRGDVIGADFTQYKGFDLLIGGSPCQDLSSTKQDRERDGLKGEKSKLFYEYLRALQEIKPKYFLLENVMMDKQWQDEISALLGVQPILINSNLVCAADRERLYWTNIPNIEQPEDKHILLKDIVLAANDVPKKYWYNKTFTYNGDDAKIQCWLDINTHTLLKKVYNLNNKCGTLTCVSGGYQEKKVYQDGKCRKLMPIEYERLQTLPDNYTKGLSDTQRYTACGNGWTVDVIAHILSFIKKNFQKMDKNV